jgi:hypothetical protein
MSVKNINEQFGEPVLFNTVVEMVKAIVDCGYTLPEDGLIEDRDYTTIVYPASHEIA